MKAFVAILALGAVVAVSGYTESGSGKTTRYWDCCKPSCSWPGKGPFNTPVATCNKSGWNKVDANMQSGCNGGGAYTCNNQQPWVDKKTNIAYGFVAGAVQGQGEWDSCCQCYEFTFTSTQVAGQKMIVQLTNTGGDLSTNHFDIMIPGGGVGIFNGCQSQFGAPWDGWGKRYGGVSNVNECNQLPAELRSGCQWRFGWFKNADNPTVNFKRVTCPAALTNVSGCKRNN